VRALLSPSSRCIMRVDQLGFTNIDLSSMLSVPGCYRKMSQATSVIGPMIPNVNGMMCCAMGSPFDDPRLSCPIHSSVNSHTWLAQSSSGGVWALHTTCDYATWTGVNPYEDAGGRRGQVALKFDLDIFCLALWIGVPSNERSLLHSKPLCDKPKS
jgi:hypothetical protein